MMLSSLLTPGLSVTSRITAPFRTGTSGLVSFVLYDNSCAYSFVDSCLSVCFRLYMHTSPTSWLYTVKNSEEKTMKLPCLM